MSAPRRAWEWLLAADGLTLIAQGSLLVLLINSNHDPAAFVVMAAVCVVALPRVALLTNPWLWFALAVGLGVRHLSDWHTLDDHIIVGAYWALGMALALGARSPHVTLAASARLLVGALFTAAAAWKLGSGEFVDGRFFRYSLLYDDRFRVVADWVGGTSSAARDANHDGLQALVDAADVGRAITLREGPRNGAVAWAFTVWGVLVEAAVALTFLLPLRERWAVLRHAALIAFCATTYVVVPIGGFGALLLVLGAAMVRTARARAAYAVGAVVLAAWAGIWPTLFL